MAAMRHEQEPDGAEMAVWAGRSRRNSVQRQPRGWTRLQVVRTATNWRQISLPLVWRHVARARLLC